MNSKFKKPEDSSGFLLWQLTNKWQRLQRDALALLNITHPQFVVLAAILWLSSQPDNIVTQKQICDFIHLDKMSVSDLIATLLSKKMLKRKPHPHDKRAFMLSLTNKGKNTALKAIPVVEHIDAQFFNKNTTNLVEFVKSLSL